MDNKLNKVIQALEFCSYNHTKVKNCTKCPYYIDVYGECRDLDMINDCKEQLKKYKTLLDGLTEIGLEYIKE